MLCPNCGANCGDQVRLCDNCEALRGTAKLPEHAALAPSPVESSWQPPAAGQELNYAGFWLRVCSFLIDGAIVLVGMNVIMLVIGLVFQISIVTFFTRFFSQKMVSSNFLLVWLWGTMAAMLGMVALVLLLAVLYFIAFECSPWQATPGKRFAGTIVTDVGGRRVSFLRAFFRYVFKFLSALFLCLGFLLPLVTQRKQTLHDMLSGCVVRKKVERPLFRLLAAAAVSLVVIAAQSYGANANKISKTKVIELDGRVKSK